MYGKVVYAGRFFLKFEFTSSVRSLDLNIFIVKLLLNTFYISVYSCSYNIETFNMLITYSAGYKQIIFGKEMNHYESYHF